MFREIETQHLSHYIDSSNALDTKYFQQLPAQEKAQMNGMKKEEYVMPSDM